MTNLSDDLKILDDLEMLDNPKLLTPRIFSFEQVRELIKLARYKTVSEIIPGKDHTGKKGFNDCRLEFIHNAKKFGIDIHV
jgi:hypothetical protein